MVVGGDGRHKLRNLMIFGGLVGVAVGSDRNEISGNGVTEAAGDGFQIGGAYNDVKDNTSVDNQNGFTIFGPRNSLARNVASQNGVGFEGTGSARTRFTSNVAHGNGVGFRVADGSSDVVLTQNVATQSDTGFDVGGTRHEVSRNTSVLHAEQGFLVSAGAGVHRLIDNAAIGAQSIDSSSGFVIAGGGGSELRKNRAMNHLNNGIAVLSRPNVIRDSVAAGNSPDLSDSDPGCAGNKWTNNVGSAGQSCIR